ncbi:MAG TPA: shikimate dehydrogenase [Caulobacteraceae bacterium]|jgi:shikimate dehydrogenase|nr:shikimate dehydrogenase [Caulobacteraceae bacterium]
MSRITGTTRVAGVIGRPVRHSLSPLIQNAWIGAAGMDAVYVALSPSEDWLAPFVNGCRGGLMAGLNVTLPFKEHALEMADTASERAWRAGAANLLLFGDDDQVTADNTDGVGLMAAFAAQAPAFAVAGQAVTVLGAGGAARGAAAALIRSGAETVRLVNRTRQRAEQIRDTLGDRVQVFGWDRLSAAFDGANALINCTSLGLEGGEALTLSLEGLPAGAVVMDMVYRPLKTPLLAAAEAAGHPIVDGLEMLIGQARPSFEALFGQAPPAGVDVRALALAALGGGDA